MGVGGSKRGGGDSLAALLERRAFEVLQQRTDRVMLVLDNVTDPAVELQILQCADTMGVQVNSSPLQIPIHRPARPAQAHPLTAASKTPLTAYLVTWWVETLGVLVPTHGVLRVERHLAPHCFLVAGYN